MSGIWLASYLVLWLFVLLQASLIFFLYRELGVRLRNSARTMNRQGVAEGSPAPQLQLQRLDGSNFLLPAPGRRTLVIFGSRRCHPCHELVPHLNRFATEKRGEAQFVFVLDESVQDAAETARELGITVEVGSSRDGLQIYQASVTPFAFLIGGDGIVRAKGLVNSRQGLELLWRSDRIGQNGSKEANNEMATPGARGSER